MRRLVTTLNSRLPQEHKRPDFLLDEAFQVWWSRLEIRLADALKASLETDRKERAIPKRKVDDVLDEILELTRLTAHQLARLGIDVDSATQQPQRLYPRGSVGESAQELNKPVDVLLEQLSNAGVKKGGG